MKILIVDDSATIRKAIARVATDKGLEPIEAENGAEALIQLRKHYTDIALVILDWNMPVMDGYDALVKIRSQSEYDNIPVMMATSDGAEEDVVKAIKAGAGAYLVKPFNSEKLASNIDSILSPESAKK